MKGKYVGIVFAKRAAGGGIAVKSSRTEWPSEGDRKRECRVWKPERRSVNKRRYVTAYIKVGARASSRVAPQEYRSCPGNGTGSFCFYGNQRYSPDGDGYFPEGNGGIAADAAALLPFRDANAEQPQGGNAHDPKVETMVNGNEMPCRSDPPIDHCKKKGLSPWNRFRIKFI